MKLDISSVRRYCDPYFLVRSVSLLVAVLAVLAMSVVTVAVSTHGGAGDGVENPVIVASKQPSPPSTPQIPSAAPQPLQPVWQGKGWPGMGPFHGGGWPGQ